eukprot:TRINITY_DN11531_c0_g1_i2.p1 TRINITY_DN11531_c0_g1~~TRINITY_DN11531_c0_g1_i2.p1  ORF type:complete len:214 (+),score=46.44 TRINITY_DN11531_c0_g1_i2:2-643(+)
MGALNILVTLLIGGSLFGYIYWNYDQLPDELVMQFDFFGNPKYGVPKYFILVPPLLTLGLGLLFNFLPSWYPPKKESPRFLRGFALYSAFFQLFMCYVTALLVEWNLGNTFPFLEWLFPSVGALLIATGWVASISVPNKYVGVRTKWTQESEENWDEVNQPGAAILCASGAAFIVGAFTSQWVALGGLIVMFAGMIGLTLYAYFKGRNPVKQD